MPAGARAISSRIRSSIPRRLTVFAFFVIVFVFAKNLNAQQAPTLSVDGNGRVSWTGEYTHSYQLQATARLENPAWTNVGTAMFGRPGAMAMTNAINGAQLFYRVVVTNGFACTNSGAAICESASFLGEFPADALRRQGTCVVAPCQQVAERFGCGSAWFSVRLREDSDCYASLTVKAELLSPPGVNYDLFMYVGSCESLRAVSQRSDVALDVVVNGVQEIAALDDSTTVWIEVRYAGGGDPGEWSLRVMTRACSE